MLSSLIAFLKALRQTLSERPQSGSGDAASTAPAPAPVACNDPLCGVMEVSCERDSEKQGLQTHSVWIRVDTKKLMERLLQNPDIDLDALQGLPQQAVRPPPLPPIEAAPDADAADAPPADWHQKVRRITQAPPSLSRPSGRPRPPPPRSTH